jgi:hypothetical protein
LTLSLLVAAQVAAAKPHTEGGRYYSPDGEFSIENDRVFKATREIVGGSGVLIDFSFRPAATIYGFSSVRNIQWVKLSDALPEVEFDATAKALVAAYKSNRLDKQNLSIMNAARVTDADVPTYAFVAIGHQQGDSGQLLLEGYVLLLGNRLGLVSELFTPTRYVNAKNLTDDMPEDYVKRWARSLRREH